MLTPQEQYDYEVESDSEAVSEKLRELRAAALEGDIELPRAQKFIAAAFHDVVISIQAVQESKARGVGGKQRQWIKALPAEACALLCLRTVLQVVLQPSDKPLTIQILGGRVGRAIELEARIRQAEKVNPLYMQRVYEKLDAKHSTDLSYLRDVYLAAYQAVMKEGAESTLSDADTLQVGKFGVQACMDAGLVSCRHTWGSTGRLVVYELTKEAEEFLLGYGAEDLQFLVDGDSRAMLRPPRDWTCLNMGGYFSPRRQFAMPLMSLRKIRKSERRRIRDEFTAEKMPRVFECANYLQSIPLALHGPTVQAMRRVWMQGGGVMGIPGKNPPEKPPFPFHEEWVKAKAPEEEVDIFRAWCSSVRVMHEKSQEWRGRVRELAGFFKHVSKHKPETPMWFPVFMDTRSRWYYRGSPNPQGSDLSKAVLHFAEKKPLGPRGLFWLKVAVASHFGFDKARFVDRAAWVDENWASIERALDAPEDHADVWGTDAPWCMFSAAWELREALRSPSPHLYETGVIVHQDATCSGIQHFSAMLRDPIGGRFVNLYDESFVGPKQDIYGEVATNALKACQRDLESTEADDVLSAKFWIERGVERALAKKPVMTYVYGATLRGTAIFVMNYMEDNGEEFPDYISRWTLCLYIARKLFQGIGRTVPSAEYAMQWLRGVARSMPKGKRMEWRSPTGFLVQHDYMDYEEVRVKLRSCGINQAVVREFNDSTRPAQMQNAIAPNFVHNLDAAHLTLTALDMKKKNLSMVGIHDSYGTHPCDVDEMHKSIREQFIDLYKDTSLLSNFLFDIGAEGVPPMRGDLDLSRVLSSEFFFC